MKRNKFKVIFQIKKICNDRVCIIYVHVQRVGMSINYYLQKLLVVQTDETDRKEFGQ